MGVPSRDKMSVQAFQLVSGCGLMSVLAVTAACAEPGGGAHVEPEEGANVTQKPVSKPNNQLVRTLLWGWLIQC